MESDDRDDTPQILNIVPKIKCPQIKGYPIRIRTFNFADIVTDQLKQQLKLHLYLRLVAVHEEVSGREVDPRLDVLAVFALDSRDGHGADPL
jgi:hypothetical protein